MIFYRKFLVEPFKKRNINLKIFVVIAHIDESTEKFMGEDKFEGFSVFLY